MKRIMLDTSVYGRLVEEPSIIEALSKRIPNEFVIYGNEIIKNELRKTPRKLLFGRNLRVLLLNLYSSFIRKDHHILTVNKLVQTLARDYMVEYRDRKGNICVY